MTDRCQNGIQGTHLYQTGIGATWGPRLTDPEKKTMRARIATAMVASFLAFGAGGAFAAGTTTTTALTPVEVRTQLASAEALIRKKSYSDAIEVLNGIVETNPREADAYNFLGYSYRKSKDYSRAERNYKRALRLNPEHKGALEYVGELYLETDRRPKAEETLAKLEKLCPTGCEELDDLRQAFASDGQTSKANW